MSGDCSRLSMCKRNFINHVIDMLSRDKYEIITKSLVYVICVTSISSPPWSCLVLVFVYDCMFTL